MDFIQATRHIFPLLKLFAISPFDISGSPGQRHIHKNRKCLIFGGIFLTFASCFMLRQLVVYSQMVFQLMDVVILITTLIFIVTFIRVGISTFLNHHKYIQIYQELIDISDLHSICYKYFTIIYYFFIFKISYFLLNTLFEISLYLNEFFIVNIYNELIFSSLELYHFAFISQLNLILISLICIFKALNENLSNFKIHSNLFYKLFNLLDQLNLMEGINLLFLTFYIFFWILASFFSLAWAVLHSKDEKLTIEIYFIVDVCIIIFRHMIVLCVLIEKLKNEVRYLFVFPFI